jgi:hypothetical protein
MNRLFQCLAMALMLSQPAVAQDKSGAYRVGLKIADQRGYANPDCYARVFANYATEVQNPENPKVKRYRAAASAGYKAELWQRCGIGR